MGVQSSKKQQGGGTFTGFSIFFSDLTFIYHWNFLVELILMVQILSKSEFSIKSY